MKTCYKALAMLEKQGQVSYNLEGSEKEKDKVRAIVQENPGIKFAAVAKKLDRSVNWVKTLVSQMEDIEKEILHDEKGAYGRKPYGLWVAEDYVGELTKYVRENGRVRAEVAAEDLELEDNYLLQLAKEVPEILITQTKKGVQLLRWAG